MIKKSSVVYGSIVIRMQSGLEGITSFFGFIYEHRDVDHRDKVDYVFKTPEDYIYYLER